MHPWVRDVLPGSNQEKQQTERLRDCFRLKDANETRQLNATHDPGLDPGPRVGMAGEGELQRTLLGKLMNNEYKFWIK